MAHVLLVDDDADIIEIYRTVLEQSGHKVAAAYSAQQAWDAMEKAVPEVLVLDVMMEEFDAGFRLAHDVAIRYPNLPILLLTAVHDYMSDAWQFDKDKDKGWLPVHRFLEKPVSPEQLLAAIKDALAGAASKS
ncbi:MAG: response regulator [Thermoanaerobaculaceae bacterium]|nr:response regulator [Thermoanaerobaculaceae bacterium]MDI9621163.1 response regulator [Acidobacteriota bacterium]NLH11261.1 response regulator [Holophagae bacterium]HPW55664.1 response regulator [Thermoanaerobaculaceae bacterium]